MASITNTSIHSYDYLLRNCYSSNRNARKALTRTTLKQNDLVQADSNALKKVARNLKNLEYSSDNGENIYNNLKVFIDSYNNLSESTSKTSSTELARMEKKLKNYIKENKDALEELGIKVSSSGKLSLDKTTLLSTSPSKVGELFSDASSFTGTIAQHAARISRLAKNISRSGLSSKQPKTKPAEPDLPVTTPSMAANAIDFKA